MAEIVMPRLSDTMEEGTILRWLKADGDEVQRGDELVEIETDKAAMVYESDQQGTLTIVAQEGATLAVGETIAHVGETPPTAGTDADKDEGPASRPARVRAVKDAPVEGGSHAAAAPAEVPQAAADDGERVKASPLAKRIAQESGIDLHGVTGSGPGGRIVKADVESVGGAGPSAPATAAAEASADAPSTGDAAKAALAGVATAKGETTTVELSRTQQTIARRMAESKATIPDFSLQMDVDMEECAKLRSDLKRLSHPDAPAQPGSAAPAVAPTYNDMVVKACALALREHPRANGSYRDGRLQLHSRVNVGVAVAADEALVVPTVFDADEKSLGEIARETRALAERVRAGTITPPELGGGTFTVSNLGMFGVKSFTAIVNPPQAAILSVGSLEQRAVVHPEGHRLAGGANDGDVVVVRHTMTLTLVCDHRILYGADAARFLARVRELLQTPSALTL
jgi:pyruvate dehydrogenase E2 component (dihydrolipoamide acetyltransferase)